MGGGRDTRHRPAMDMRSQACQTSGRPSWLHTHSQRSHPLQSHCESISISLGDCRPAARAHCG